MLDVTSFVAGIAATALIAVIVWRLFRRSIDATRQEALQLRREIEHRQTEADASLETMTDRIDRVERSLASLRFKLTAPVLHDPYPDSFSLGGTTLSRSIVGPPIDLPSDLAERPLHWKPRRPLAEHDTDQDKAPPVRGNHGLLFNRPTTRWQAMALRLRAFDPALRSVSCDRSHRATNRDDPAPWLSASDDPGRGEALALHHGRCR